ncbi:MAG TPA: penicillin-binding protein [Candidatus Binataceae bacterium]|nr:penicillin-binding protein [Candidatus Binataceae bacterium]
MTTSFKQRRSRIGALTFILAGLFGLAVMRLIALVVLQGSILNSMAREEHNAETELAAVRGPIVDRHGEPMAMSAETRSVYARPAKLTRLTSSERAKIARALEMTDAELAQHLSKRSPFVWLRRRMDPAKASIVEAMNLEGIGALSEYKRFYPESNLAGAVVGSAGMDGQGLSGVELEYDKMIRGAPVQLSFYHDALGHPILDSPLEIKAPQPGAQVELTIDGRIQSLAENELAQEVHTSGAARGAAIVLDPWTGEVLALANVNANPDAVHDRLHDAAVQDAFEPGSTMKGLLASIALTNHTITPSEQIFCENGVYHLDGRTIHDDARHGWLDLAGIIEVSSNIGASKIALRLGSNRFYDGLRGFGLGRRTGIDLPGEATGLLGKGSTWKEIELANHGFGQGVAVTPMQLAVAYSAIANGGLVVRPYVVKSVSDTDGRVLMSHAPQVLGRAIPPEVAHQMNLLLRNVVNGDDGTAHKAQVDGFTVAGKTGTAQMVDPISHRYFQNRHVSSFVGFLPADDPKLLILVVLYDVGHGHFGGLVAAPVFSEIASGALRDLNIASKEPDYDSASLLSLDHFLATPHKKNADPLASIDPGVDYDAVLNGKATPDFRGTSLRHALDIARQLGVNLDVQGQGYVSSQEPAPGTPLPRSAIKLRLVPSGTSTADADGLTTVSDSSSGKRKALEVRSDLTRRSSATLSLQERERERRTTL